MTTEYFRVRNGLTVGEDTFTVDGTTGDVVVTGDLTVAGNDIKVSGGTGAITFVPITGQSPMTTFTGNVVKGIIRHTSAQANGDIWGTGSSGTSGASRGISIDNTGNTAKRNSIVMRGYNNNRSSLIGEMASGSPASPAVPSSGFTIIEMAASGYNGGGADGWVSSQGNGYVGRALFAASETWTTTSTGTNFVVGVNPTGYVGIFPQVLQMNPVSSQTNTDTFTFASKFANVGGTQATQMTVTEALVSTAGDLKVGGNDIQASDGATNITLTSNTLTAFAGDIKVGGNDIQASDGATNITMTSNTLTAVAGDLQINGNDILASDGQGNITLTSNTLTAFAGDIKVGGNDIQASDGSVAETFSVISGQSPNTKFSGNVVKGIIRQTVAESAGDVYGYNLGTTNPYRGISIDNTASSTTTTGKRTGLVMRNYANAPRNSIIGESARGTNPSSPLSLTNNSNLVEMVGNGYAATSDGTGFQATGCTITGTTLTIGTVTAGAPAVGQLISSITYPNVVTAGTTITANISGSGSGSTWTVSASQTVASSTIWGGGDGWIASNNGVPAGIRFQAFENWTTQTSGTGMIVTLSPLAATNGIAGAGFNALSMSLSSTTLASDSQTFRTRPAGAGGTNFAMLSLTESLATVGGDLRVNGNDIQASDGATNITLTSNTLTSFAGDIKVGGNDIQNSAGQTNISMTSDRSQTTITSSATTIQDPASSGNNVLIETTPTKSVYALYGVSTDASVVPTVNYIGYRRSAGTNAPTQANDRLGQFKFGGNTNTGTGGPTTPVTNGEIRYYATENWTDTQNGTAIGIEVTKTGTIDNVNVFLSDAVQTELRGDTIKFVTGVGPSPVDLAQLTAANSVIITDRLDVRGSTVNSPYMVLFKDGGNDVVMGISQTRATQGYENAVFNFTTQRSADGINYTPTQNGDTIGEYKFNGNAVTSTTPTTAGPTATINVTATENWTSTAQGSQFNFGAVKTGTTTSYNVITGSPTSLELNADVVTLQHSDGTDYLVLDTNKALFSKPVRTKITTASVAKGATYTPAASALNSIILEITAGTGVTAIDVSNLTVAGENAVFDIMVYNNSGGNINANDFEIINGGVIALDHASQIANGARAMFEINCVDAYANAKFAGDAV